MGGSWSEMRGSEGVTVRFLSLFRHRREVFAVLVLAAHFAPSRGGNRKTQQHKAELISIHLKATTQRE